MSERCWNCGAVAVAHVGGRCQKPLSVAIDADAIDRLNRSGHPRLLKNVLTGNATGGFAGVQIEALRVVEAIQ